DAVVHLLALRSHANVAIVERAYADAARLLDRAAALASRLRRGIDDVEIKVQRALVSKRLGEADLAATWAEAVSIARSLDLRRVVLDAPTELHALAPGVASEPAGTAPAPPERARAQAANGLLTPKETDVLQLLARSMSNKQIANALGVGDETIKWHVKNLLNKLGGGTQWSAHGCSASSCRDGGAPIARGGEKALGSLTLPGSDRTAVQRTPESHSVSLENPLLHLARCAWSACARVIDPTSRHCAHGAHTERHFKALSEAVDRLVVCLDADGCILEVNPCACRTAQRAATELLGRDWAAAMVAPAHQARARAQFDAAMGGACLAGSPCALQAPDGHAALVRWTLTVVSDVEGAPCGALAIG